MQTQLVQVKDALDWLRVFHEFSVGNVMDYLGDKLDQANMLTLYRTLFPAQYKRSKASLERGELYSAKEQEFFELVNQRLFPLDDVWLVERDNNIPYMLAGIDVETLDQYDWPIQALGALIWEYYRGMWEMVLEELGMDTCSVPLPLEGRVYWKKLVRLCKRAGGAMACLPDALNVIAHDTGNFLLDVCPETYEPIPWTLENVRQLAIEWKRANRIMARFGLVVDWLRDNPPGLAPVVETWNRCIEQAPGDPQFCVVSVQEMEARGSWLPEDYLGDQDDEGGDGE